MKVGVVGLGSIGKRHATNIATLGHEAVCYDPAIRRDVKFERNVYETCDAVVIATPTQFHQGGIRACAERGKHMLVEKPISITDAGLPELLDLAARNGAIVMVGNNLRFHASVEKAKQWIDTNNIGDPIWASFTCGAWSQKHPYLSDGVILNTGAHEVDLSRHLLGPAYVLCATVRKGAYGDDIADFVLQHENGCRSTFHLDFVSRIEVRNFRIVGTEGDMVCNLPERSLLRRQADLDLAGVVYTEDYRGIGNYDTDYLDEMAAFIDRIAGKKVPGATGADGLATLRLLLDVRSKAGVAPR